MSESPCKGSFKTARTSLTKGNLFSPSTSRRTKLAWLHLTQRLSSNQTYPWPDMLDFCPHYSVHRVLVAKPVLPAAIHHPAVGALDHIPAQEEDRSPLWQVLCTRQHKDHREQRDLSCSTHPDQAYLARPSQGESVEAEVFGTTLTSIPRS